MPTILNHWSVLSLLFVLLFIVGIVVGYIDIPLKVHNEGAEIAFNVPMMISNIQYSISVSLENKE